MRALALAAGVSLVVASSGCLPASRCRDDGDCRPPHACVDGACVTPGAATSSSSSSSGATSAPVATSSATSQPAATSVDRASSAASASSASAASSGGAPGGSSSSEVPSSAGVSSSAAAPVASSSAGPPSSSTVLRPSSASSSASAAPPSSSTPASSSRGELCNNLDDDGDGRIDEGLRGCVSTWAGNTEWATAHDASGIAAVFGGPAAIAVDATGAGAPVLVVADASARRIRRVDTMTGAVTTLAGSGFYGEGNGPALLATMVDPNGVAVASDGAVLFSDAANGKIRRIAGGIVSDHAGNGYFGWRDGAGPTAMFAEPWGLAFDGAGRLYVADALNHVIRRIDPGNPPTVATVAGAHGVFGDVDGAPADARFRKPRGIHWDEGTGVLLIADSGNNKVRAYSPGATGNVWTVAGMGVNQEGFVNGPATTAWFDYPSSVAMRADGAVIVGDRYNVTIRLITNPLLAAPGTNMGTVSTLLTDVYSPMGMAVIGATLYVGESFRADILAVNASDGTSTVLAGSGQILEADGPGRDAGFASPTRGAARADGVMLVSDVMGCRVRSVTAVPGVGPWVASFAGDGRCRSLDGTGRLVSIDRPRGIAVVPDGGVYVAAEGARVLLKVAADGGLTLVAGTYDTYGYQDGPALSARFKVPQGLAFDPATGGIVVADENAQVIRVYDPATQQVGTLAGDGTWGHQDGPPGTAHFASPVGVAVAPDGTVYVADPGNCAVRAIAPGPSRTVSTVVGGPTKCGSSDATPASLALIGNVTGVALSADLRFIVFTEPGSGRLRTVDLVDNAVVTLAGGTWGNTDGDALTQASFRQPWDTFILPAGEVVVLDTISGQVRVLGAL